MALETISSADFDRFRRLLYEHSGIHLADNKQPLLIGRLGRRLRELGLDSYADYYQRVTQPGCEVERQRMIDLLTTNETHFFREPQHFVYLREHILPRHPAGTPFRAWSAASSPVVNASSSASARWRSSHAACCSARAAPSSASAREPWALSTIARVSRRAVTMRAISEAASSS